MRRTGLTFAPEAGTWRMRQVINKLIREEDLYGAVESAFSQGWRRVKLYFLTGLPTETDEDTLGHRRAGPQLRGHRPAPQPGRSPVTASVGGFVPKPQTPFQWFGQDTAAESAAQGRPAARRHPARQGRPAAVARPQGHAGRGDRQPGRPPGRRGHRGGVAARAAPSRSGPSTSTWTVWTDAMARHGLSIDWYVHRDRDRDEVLPWAHISAGLHEDFLWQEWEDALAAAGTPDCRWTPCYDCGACTGYGIEHVVASAGTPRRREPGDRPGPGPSRSAASVPVQSLVRPVIASGRR